MAKAACYVVLALVLLAGCSARRLSQTQSTDPKDVTVNVRNTFAEGDENEVGQAVNLIVPPPKVVVAPPKPVIKVSPAKKVDPMNPDCSLDHDEEYTKMTFNASPYVNVKKEKVKFYVDSDVEVKPVGYFLLQQNRRDGKATVSGSGLTFANEKATKEHPMRTICGEWTHSNNGIYEYEITSDDTRLWIQYYIRPRSLDTYTGDKIPLNVVFQLEQTIVGNNNNIVSDANVSMQKTNGTLVLTLLNGIKGTGNKATQTVGSETRS
ncbi:hypothetical protein TetV_027 [Tetraselmis virus 1]|uniref:Lipoprotein n=1 Tax=Tetraselmis virus 1 TaxID=2060617 RepID=A0A2P0VN16_9VIRU|nr:hypothetical protein QJ968_gp027 [Tetraselmis virus 1]AUF82119.1 hypothetical protein TetV_027 [Tetraselmis virus 1]